jgi:tRNA G26 N,N-dimethylase Trm1
MELRLTLDERQLLAEILRQHQRELSLEISHTDHHEFKTRLRARAQMLEEVLEKLGASQFAAN